MEISTGGHFDSPAGLSSGGELTQRPDSQCPGFSPSLMTSLLLTGPDSGLHGSVQPEAGSFTSLAGLGEMGPRGPAHSAHCGKKAPFQSSWKPRKLRVPVPRERVRVAGEAR